MTGDHHGRAAGRATLLVTPTDEILGTHNALNTQDDVRRDHAEHNDLSHVHNLTRSRIGRYVCGHAQAQVADVASG
jgi:hypothetical protein